MTRVQQKRPREDQLEAIDAVLDGFKQHDRGKLIMACGTGKTYTALRIAEEQVPPGGIILFLAPSITLVSQSVREWGNDASVSLRIHAVCSDPKGRSAFRRAKTRTPTRSPLTIWSARPLPQPIRSSPTSATAAPTATAR